MTITRERKSDHSERKTDWRSHPCPCERSCKRVRDFYRKYAGGGRISGIQGRVPLYFFVQYDIA